MCEKQPINFIFTRVPALQTKTIEVYSDFNSNVAALVIRAYTYNNFSVICGKKVIHQNKWIESKQSHGGYESAYHIKFKPISTNKTKTIKLTIRNNNDSDQTFEGYFAKAEDVPKSIPSDRKPSIDTTIKGNPVHTSFFGDLSGSSYYNKEYLAYTGSNVFTEKSITNQMIDAMKIFTGAPDTIATKMQIESMARSYLKNNLPLNINYSDVEINASGLENGEYKISYRTNIPYSINYVNHFPAPIEHCNIENDRCEKDNCFCHCSGCREIKNRYIKDNDF